MMKSFRDLADQFVSDIANAKGIVSITRGELTGRSITVENLVCTHAVFTDNIEPILRKYTHDQYYAYMHEKKRADERRRLGEDWRYTVMLVMDLDEDETKSTS